MTDIRDQERMADFQRVDDLVKKFVEEVMQNLYDREDVYGKDVREVENKSRDGFIPYTDGGWEGIGYQSLDYCHGSGYTPKAIQPYIDSSIKDAEEEWDREHPEQTVAWLYDEEANDNDRKQLSLLPGYNPTKRDTLREEWYEHERSYLDATFFYKVRALYYGPDNHRNETGEPEVLFFVGINTDFDYGRDSIPWLRCYGGNPQQSNWLWEEQHKVSDIDQLLIDEMVAEANNALNNA